MREGDSNRHLSAASALLELTCDAVSQQVLDSAWNMQDYMNDFGEMVYMVDQCLS